LLPLISWTLLLMKTPALVTAAVCASLLIVHLYFETLKPTTWQHHSNPQAAPQDNPVLAALRAAAAGDTNSRSLVQKRDGATHNDSCCRIGSMQGVLAAAAAFQKAARSLDAAGNMQEARQMMLSSRPHLAKPWADGLHRVVAANL
jgi:hypothetical protein